MEYKVKINFDIELFRKIYGVKGKSVAELQEILNVEKKEGRYVLKIESLHCNLDKIKKYLFVHPKELYDITYP